VRVALNCVHGPSVFVITQILQSGAKVVLNQAAVATLLGDSTGVDLVIDIKNVDTPLCYPTNYSLVYNTLPNWQVTFNPPYISLSANQEAQIFVHIQPPPRFSGVSPVNISVLGTNQENDMESSVEFSSSVVISEQCQRFSPVVTVPNYNPVVLPGQSSELRFFLQDVSDAKCSDVTYTLLASVPASWSAVFQQTQVTISPGGNYTGTVQITLPFSANGTYNISVIAKNAQSPLSAQTQLSMSTGYLCGMLPPVVVPSSDTFQLNAKQAAYIQLTVTNPDTPNCPTTIFSLSSSDQNNLSMMPNYLRLDPGQTGSIYVVKGTLTNQLDQSTTLQLTLRDDEMPAR